MRWLVVSVSRGKARSSADDRVTHTTDQKRPRGAKQRMHRNISRVQHALVFGPCCSAGLDEANSECLLGFVDGVASFAVFRFFLTFQ